MPSLIPGYNYDIFISYRQKDNKHDGWVTEFVNNLKGELESTFKEEISVYFDINPHDGLLETHDVDASLKEKLKCLIFIPIISRTYCDPKSFAWEHEFKTFIDLASKDQFGLKIKLPNGNVSNRVLPVRTHDLDPADIRLCELILDGVLRGIEFIYEEPGVNRPLTEGDDENKNLKKTRYRNQINKVALTINEIVQGLMTEPEWQKFEKRIEEEEFRQTEESVEKESAIKMKASGHITPRKLIPGTLVVALLAAVLFFTWTKIFKRDTLETLRSSGQKISVAVLPFRNIGHDTTLNYLEYGIQEMMTAFLSNYSVELKVRQTDYINSFIKSNRLKINGSVTSSKESQISKKLDATIFITGTFIQEGSEINLDAQLIESKTSEVFRSFKVEGPSNKIMPTIDTLSGKVKDYLILSKLKNEASPDIKGIFGSTNSPEAFRYFLYSKDAFMKSDYSTAREMALKSLKIDSTYISAMIMLAFEYGNTGNYKDAKTWCLKAYNKREQMPLLEKTLTNYAYAYYFETLNEVVKYLGLFIEIDEGSPLAYYNLGDSYNSADLYDKAIPEFEKALEIYNKLGLKPSWVFAYSELGTAYHHTQQYNKEKKLYKKAEQDFPNDQIIIRQQAIISLTEGDSISANQYIRKYISIIKDKSASDAAITTSMADIYNEAGILDKAEKFYRQRLSLKPYNSARFHNLARFLIHNDRGIIEGLQLVDEALKLTPDNYIYLDTKGWGLYKQGKYKEAVEILQKSWDLRMKNAIYNHSAFLHLEAAKKAVFK